ncbi:DUF3368 domain-containing protein [Leucothrix pacifica]|uniref:DUF3368 domain-containing protein n=1 Tax=Leucothrix pacifica TaxID=1247513 RepID=A0A317C9U3_9GAMM|nr:DUF3368 domain-containing protein [Leucothrix pacifica]PWQ95465.1 DUF3368 domain-containing protein [Leucothrix pacifica]
MKRSIIVADAGPLIALAKLEQLELLHEIFSEVHVPETVYLEVTHHQARDDAQLLTSFIKASAELHPVLENSFVEELSQSLDDGEVQALALAQSLECGVLMDEARGRKIADYYEISVVGMLGVLLQAKQLGLIESVKPLIYQLQKANYRLSTGLVSKVLSLAKE